MVQPFRKEGTDANALELGPRLSSPREPPVMSSDVGRERLLAIFLTDLEGSTQHWQRHRQQMSDVLDVLDRAVEAAVSEGGGEIVRSRGEW